MFGQKDIGVKDLPIIKNSLPRRERSVDEELHFIFQVFNSEILFIKFLFDLIFKQIKSMI